MANIALSRRSFPAIVVGVLPLALSGGCSLPPGLSSSLPSQGEFSPHFDGCIYLINPSGRISRPNLDYVIELRTPETFEALTASLGRPFCQLTPGFLNMPDGTQAYADRFAYPAEWDPSTFVVLFFTADRRLGGYGFSLGHNIITDQAVGG